MVKRVARKSNKKKVTLRHKIRSAYLKLLSHPLFKQRIVKTKKTFKRKKKIKDDEYE